MTSDEIKQTLKDVLMLTKSMNKEHLKKILQILTAALCKQESESNSIRDIRKNIKKSIDTCQQSNQLELIFTRRQIKDIYKIMGDYGFYPICKLCGQPIKIDSGTHRHSEHHTPLEFSWDHIWPKSLGGSNDLSNLQVTHKLCNNLRGNLTQPEREHYVINITVNFISVNTQKKRKHRRKAKQDLKQQIRKHYAAHSKNCHCCRCRG